MRITRLPFATRILIAGIIFCWPLITVISADASSIGRAYIGYTKIKFDPDFIKAMNEAGVEINGIKPGFFNAKRGVAVFPMVAGSIDFDNLLIEFIHTGGLAFGAKDGFYVESFNFIVSNIFEFGYFPPAITGMTAIDGIMEARDMIFEVDFTEENVDVKRKAVIMRNVQVRLSPYQAFNFNSLFGTNFVGGEMVGEAKVFARMHVK